MVSREKGVIMKSLIVLLTISLVVPQIDSAQELPLIYTKFKYISKDDNYYSEVIPEKYKMLILNSAARWGLPVPILASLVWAESRYYSDAININKNDTTDRGLLQLNSSNYEEFKWRFNNNEDYDPHDPETNLRIGCQYLIWIYNNPKIGKGKWFNTIVFWNGSKESSKKLARFVLGYR